MENPLLVSVRSGARASMPGMMDTILNLGLNDVAVEGFAAKTGNPRFAYDSYRRFIQMYSDVVMEVPKSFFEKIIDEVKEAKGIKYDTEMSVEDLKELVKRFKEVYKKEMHGKDFPQDPVEQLIGAVKAVFRSWDNPRAQVYRRMNDIPSSWGTAVNVQSMVFGNMGDDCGTGVAFTRDPGTGEKGLFGEFLTNAQGEDVVAGVRTPMKISEMEEKFPEAFKQFNEVCKTLENHYRDMQDMEFTVEHGKLYMLQTRNGKRTAKAALKIACDLVDEGMRTEEEAVMMIDPRNLDTLLHPQFDAEAIKKALEDAKKNLIYVKMVGTTVPHKNLGVFGAGKVLIMPAAQGTGVIAGSSARIVLEACGLKDVRAKSIGSSNIVNVAYATLEGLKQLKTIEQVAKLRGLTKEEILG